MFSHQESFRFSITVLLFQVITDCRTPEMPDKCGRAETNFMPGLLQAPAEVHVISCLHKDGIESSNLFQDGFIKGHVAARDVLGLAVGKHDSRWTAGRSHYR